MFPIFLRTQENIFSPLVALSVFHLRESKRIIALMHENAERVTNWVLSLLRNLWVCLCACGESTFASDSGSDGSVYILCVYYAILIWFVFFLSNACFITDIKIFILFQFPIPNRAMLNWQNISKLVSCTVFDCFQ